MRWAFNHRDITQDNIAASLGVNKALISKRLRGDENLTLKTLSFMGTALKCRIQIRFVPYEQVGTSNEFSATNSGSIVEEPPKLDNWKGKRNDALALVPV